MLRQVGRSGAMSADLSEIERRLRSLEQRLKGADVSARASHTADYLGDAIASAWSSVADRFRGGAGSVDPAKIAIAAAKLGNDALGRLSREVEHRPLVTLAVALGLGILVGLASHRR
jgi:hypothetical protein